MPGACYSDAAYFNRQVHRHLSAKTVCPVIHGSRQVWGRIAMGKNPAERLNFT
jgi:hypothetical protein